MPHALPPFVQLDFADPDASASGGASLRFRDPVAVLRADTLGDVAPLLAEVERATRGHGLHAVGFVSYDAAPAFDAALAVPGRSAVPLAWFGLYREPERCAPDATLGDHTHADARGDAPWTPSDTRDAYDAAIGAIRAAIGDGEVYQVNHTLRLRRALGDRGAAASLARYERLRDAQRASYTAYLDIGDWRVLSASPELFFARRGSRVTCRPMKGTAPRGRWAEEDEAHARALASSPKERAENVMIVDLVRNDLGRVARTGTVQVERLLDVERYPTVLQLTSTVTAEVEPATTLGALFAALFPCGSITGAPKVAASRWIARLEREPRGPYCGAIGHVAPGGDATFNVAIRTVVEDVARGTAEYGVGGGITWDSAAAAEYDETVAKAAVLGAAPAPTPSLIETMRATREGVPLLEAHLARLAGSARYHGIPYDEAAVRREVAATVERAAASPALADATAWRLRLLLHPDGAVEAAAATLVERPPDQPLRVALAAGPVHAGDVRLHHKTTHRAPYERALAARPGVDDVLLWNEAREATELTIGNLVVELDGALVTPPRSCGLLGGVFRQSLLDAGTVREAVVPLAALARASALWRVNAVRGWERIALVPDPDDARPTLPDAARALPG